MAVLKDLIVHGRSRFINGIDADSIHANLIDVNDGIFKTITTTTLDANTITTEMLNATNARVAQTLTVEGTISTNKWEAANIANIGGNFYISPTGKADSGTITVTKTGSVTINGVSVGVYTLVVGSASFGVTSTNSTVWGPTSGNQSKVIFTGSISYNNSKKYPLGTCNGTMTALSTGTNTLTGFTITGINSPALDIFFKEVGVSSVSSTACSGYEMQISVYQTYSNSALRPVGILLTSYGKEKKQYIDIYNGENALGDSASGFATPGVRIGLLDGLPDIRDGVTASDSPTKPSGWGIYTSNGFFKGKVVANAGLIATWNIGSTSIYSGTNSMTSTTQGTYIGTGTDATSGIRNYKDANTFVNISQGVITAKAVDLTGKITATSGSIAGWRIESSYLASGSATSPAANVLLLSPAGTTSSYTIAGQAKTGWVITAGTTFGVNKDGGIYATSGKIGGFDIGTTYLRNGNITSATNTSVAGIYLGTDGLNISNGTAATTSYITKTAVNIGNKLTWNGTTLTIDGSASIGGTTASTVVSNAADGATAKEGLDNLEIGGRNLFRYTSLTDVMSNKWNKTGTVACSVNGDKLTITGAGEVFPTSTYYTPYIIPINTTITLSCYFYENTVSDGNRYIYYAVTPGWRNKRVPANYVGLWSETFTTTEELTVLCPEYDLRNSTGGQWVVSPLKLEIGNKATAWSPAPEDLDVHKYVTDIDSNNGITIKAINGTADTNTTTGNYIKLNASGLDIYNKGVSVAFYGATARIGKASTARVEIDSSPYVNLYNSSNKLALSVQGSGLFVYDQSGYKRAGVTSNGFILYDGASSSTTTQLGSFTASSGNATIKLGQEAANKFNILITDTAVSSKGPGILLRQGTNVLNEITANGMKLYLASDTTNSIADFGDNIRIGATTTGHAVLDEDGMDVFIGDTSVAHYGDYARIGKAADGEAYTMISPREVTISAGNNINALKITSDGNTQIVNKTIDINRTIAVGGNFSYTHPSEPTTGTILSYQVYCPYTQSALGFSITKGTSASGNIVDSNQFKFSYSATATTLTITNTGTQKIVLQDVGYKVETVSPKTEIGGLLTLGQYPDVGSNTVFAVGNGTEGALSNAFVVRSNGSISINGSSDYSGYVIIKGEQAWPVPDTGWVTLPLSSGSGTLQYRCVGKIVYIVGTGLNVTHNTNFVTLPAAIRPTIRITCSASFPVDKNIYVNLYANGQMAAIQNGGGSISNLFFTMSYPI